MIGPDQDWVDEGRRAAKEDRRARHAKWHRDQGIPCSGVAGDPYCQAAEAQAEAQSPAPRQEAEPYTREELAAVEEEYAVISDPNNFQWTRTRRFLFLNETTRRLLATARQGVEDRERLDWLETQRQEHFGFGDVKPIATYGVAGELMQDVRAAIDAALRRAARTTGGKDE